MEENKNYETMNNLFIIQVNLNKCIDATRELILNAQQWNVDIALVQEPYTGRNIKTPPHIKVISAENADQKTQVIIFNPKLKAALLTDFSSSFCTIVRISTRRNIFLASVYAPPGTTAQQGSLNLSRAMGQLDMFLEKSDSSLLIGGDFNAKHDAWGSLTADAKGSDLMDWISSRNLHLLNLGSTSTFDTVRAGQRFKSVIDLTICSSSILPYVNSWMVMDEETSSDHRYIKITLAASKKSFTQTTNRYSLKGINLLKYHAKLSSVLKRNAE